MTKTIYLLTAYAIIMAIAIFITNKTIAYAIPKQKMITPILVNVSGTKLSSKEKTLFKKVNPFGVLLFKYNLTNKQQSQNLITEIRNLFPKRKIYILLDHEGGKVNRLHSMGPSDTSLSAMEYGKKADKNLGQAKKLLYKNVSIETSIMNDLGIDVNLAPVVDLSYKDAFGNLSSIASDKRAYHHNHKIVTELAAEFIKATHDNHLYATLKHIPGLSESFNDTHDDFITINKTLDDLIKTDFLPFKKLSPQVKFAMVNHIIYSAIDDKPASLSKKTIDVIRKEIGFKGLLIADAFNMDALNKYAMKDRINMSLKAGIDIVIPNVNSDRIFYDAIKIIDKKILIKFNQKLKEMNL